MQKFALSASRARFACTLSTPFSTPSPAAMPLSARHAQLWRPLLRPLFSQFILPANCRLVNNVASTHTHLSLSLPLSFFTPPLPSCSLTYTTVMLTLHLFEVSSPHQRHLANSSKLWRWFRVTPHTTLAMVLGVVREACPGQKLSKALQMGFLLCHFRQISWGYRTRRFAVA